MRRRYRLEFLPAASRGLAAAYSIGRCHTVDGGDRFWGQVRGSQGDSGAFKEDVKLRDKTAVAHLEGIVTARDAAGVRPAEASKTVVYVTSETHHCIEKRFESAGWQSASSGRRRWTSADRLRAEARRVVRADRRAGLRPWLVVATAGRIGAGAVSSGRGGRRRRRARSVAARGRRVGGFFVLTTHGRAVLAGIERSRTVVMDPHKDLFLPFGSGALIVRDERQLAQAHRYSADYLADARGAGVYSASDLSVELSRPPRLWLPLKLATNTWEEPECERCRQRHRGDDRESTERDVDCGNWRQSVANQPARKPQKQAVAVAVLGVGELPPGYWEYPSVTSLLCAANAARTSSFSRSGTWKKSSVRPSSAATSSNWAGEIVSSR
jgi:Pyridoxal-dependent decarboxylase conserved domain